MSAQPIDRRDFIKLSAAAAATLAVSGCGSLLPQDKRPNVLFIMDDQHRFDALGCLGHPVVKTPHLDRFVEESVSFTSATTSSPLCGPARASLLTGQFIHGHRCWRNSPLEGEGLKADAVTRDEIMTQAGWTSAYFGKWHTGKGSLGCYTNTAGIYGHGADEYTAYLKDRYPDQLPAKKNQKVCRYTHWPYDPYEVDNMMQKAKNKKMYMPHHNEAGRIRVAPEDTLTAWTVDQTIDYLKNNTASPFNITCSILNPHCPLVATEPWLTMYDPKDIPLPNISGDNPPPKASIPSILTRDAKGLGSFLSLYYGLISEVDHHVGRLLQALDESGQGANTLVVFLSDHGEMGGDHGYVSKGVFYEPAFRVPWIVRLPRKAHKGLKLDVPASGADVTPTILDLCGLPVPKHMHGRSLKSAITQSSTQPAFVYGDLGGPRRKEKAPNGYKCHSFGWRSNREKLVISKNRAYYYDLVSDPGEFHNLLHPANRKPAHIDRARQLKKGLMNHMEELGSKDTSSVDSVTL